MKFNKLIIGRIENQTSTLDGVLCYVCNMIRNSGFTDRR